MVTEEADRAEWLTLVANGDAVRVSCTCYIMYGEVTGDDQLKNQSVCELLLYGKIKAVALRMDSTALISYMDDYGVCFFRLFIR